MESKSGNLNQSVFFYSADMVAVLSTVATFTNFLGGSPDIVFGIFALDYIALGAMIVSYIRSAPSQFGYIANSSIFQRRAFDSLDEGSKAKGESYSFLRQFNLIGKFSNRENSAEYRILQEFNKDEEYSFGLRERRSLLKNSSGSGYGSGCTTSML